MGSRLDPIIANIFMDNFERRHMIELNKLGVKTGFIRLTIRSKLLKTKINPKKYLNSLITTTKQLNLL